MPDEQSVTRSWLSWLVMSFQPSFSSPTRVVAGTRTSSKYVWLMSDSPITWIGRTLIPGVSMGRTNREIPLCFLTFWSVRTASQM